MPQWSEAARAAAKELFSRGMAATDAASEFSRRFKPITRNAMCGLWFRMGLSRNDPRAAKARQMRGRVIALKTRHQASRHLTQQIEKPAGLSHIRRDEQEDRVASPFAHEPIAANLEDSSSGPCGCNIFALTNRTCRWPIGDVGTPEFLFCGSPQANLKAGIPYCPQHACEARA